MNKKSTATTELKHFIRADSRAKKREIVVEQVKAGSASFEFLKKMESRRKKHECVRGIDMRGKVPYECKSYIHKNQVFWMDDISYGIFLKGLKENNNVFTNDCFEQIVNGDHTNHKTQQAAVTQAAAQNVQNNDPFAYEPEPDVFSESKFHIEGKDADLFHLGYFQRRRESRIRHTTDILIHCSGKTISAKTKDISATGFKASFTKPVNLANGDEVLVTFTGFNNSHASKLFDVKYKVVGIEYNEPEFILRAIHNNEKDEKTKEFFFNFIDEQKQNIKGRRKIDIEDTRLTAESIITELFYTISTPTVPFFIGTTNKKAYLQTVCINAINKPLIQCFKNRSDSFDFTNMSEAGRIEKLMNTVKEDGQSDPILAVFMSEDAYPKVMFEYDFDSFENWQKFLIGKMMTKNLRLFKVIIRNVASPDQRKLDQKIDKLKTKSESSVAEMLKYYQKITSAGVLVDVTEEICSNLKGQQPDMEALKVVNSQADKFARLSGNDVDVLQFGYTEQRREDRYHVSVDAIVHINKKKIKAVTRDISLKGLCVELKSDSLEGCKKGEEVKVDFPVLHQRAKEKIKLVDMAYTITCIHYENGKPILHFKRVKTQHWNAQTGFFKDMIDRNIKLIKLDTQDIETATKSKLIGSTAVENTATLPLFILKNTEGNGRSANIALPPNPSDLTDFFEVEPNVYNFKAITHPNRLSRLTAHLKTENVTDLIIYMYKKQIPGIAKFNIYSAIDSDFENESEKDEFMSICKENDYCVIKVSVSRVQKPIDTEITQALEPLQEVAPHSVHRLHNHFKNIVAIGDISDISRQMIISL